MPPEPHPDRSPDPQSHPQSDSQTGSSSGSALDPIAERYVRLVLAVGLHDPDYLDSYDGPPQWRRQTEEEAPSLREIRTRASELAGALPPAEPGWEKADRLRHRFLAAHVEALRTRVRMLEGEHLSFDEESRALYGTVVPRHHAEEFLAVLERIDRRLADEGVTGGTLQERIRVFRREFVVPPERVDAVFRASLETVREITARHLPLPPGERVRVEYVEDTPWSAYNWYRGDSESLIQVNVSIPLRVQQLLDLACHEGYPGHHAHHCQVERHLLRGRGWIEHAAYALFSPQALTSEGVATVALDLVFSDRERRAFLRDELFPRAGLDPSRVPAYLEVLDLQRELAPVSAETARRHLDGETDADAAARWMVRHAAVDPPRAARAIEFHRRYRAYVVTYSRGREILHAHLEHSGGERDRATRWRRFGEVVTTPTLLSDLEPRVKLPPRSPLDPSGALSPAG